MYLLRLDDAAEYMNLPNWERMERLCDKYGIQPLIGVIPQCEDQKLMAYGHVDGFRAILDRWQAKGYSLALHGFNHVFETDEGGINPVNQKSEFAGLPLERQEEKIKAGVRRLAELGIAPRVFFAPAHTFDRNTLEALRACSEIRIISDTIANDCYFEDGFCFVPQQSGRVRDVRFRTTTFCYHPNTMKPGDFTELEAFLAKNQGRFSSFDALRPTQRKRGAYDKLLRLLYFTKRKLH